MPTLHSKRNYAALGGLCCVIALFFALKDPVAVRKSEEDAAAARRRELVTSAGATCTLGYAGGDLSMSILRYLRILFNLSLIHI